MLALVRSNMFFFVFNRQTENWRRVAGVLSIPTVEAEKVFLPRPPNQLPKKNTVQTAFPSLALRPPAALTFDYVQAALCSLRPSSASSREPHTDPHDVILGAHS